MQTIDLNNSVVQIWTKGRKVVNSVWSDNEAAFYVTTKDKENKYSLLRFFQIGDNTACSTDIPEMEVDKFLTKLFDLFAEV